MEPFLIKGGVVSFSKRSHLLALTLSLVFRNQHACTHIHHIQCASSHYSKDNPACYFILVGSSDTVPCVGFSFLGLVCWVCVLQVSLCVNVRWWMVARQCRGILVGVGVRGSTWPLPSFLPSLLPGLQFWFISNCVSGRHLHFFLPLVYHKKISQSHARLKSGTIQGRVGGRDGNRLDTLKM